MYNYTGLTAHIPSDSLIIAITGWSSARPTGLAICTSVSDPNSCISRTEFNNSTDQNTHISTFAFVTTGGRDMFLFERRSTTPTSINYFYMYTLHIHTQFG